MSGRLQAVYLLETPLAPERVRDLDAVHAHRHVRQRARRARADEVTTSLFAVSLRVHELFPELAF